MDVLIFFGLPSSLVVRSFDDINADDDSKATDVDGGVR